MLKEWPLVAFTILGQMAVGAFLVFHAPFLDHRKMPAAGWRETWLTDLAVVIVLTVLAALVSFFHLRHPIRARRALSNLRTSWLSREILFELGFLGLVGLAAILALSRSAANGAVPALLIAAGLAGLLFLMSMAKLYMLPTLPAWSDIFTPLSFFLTAFNLGAMVTEIIIHGRGVQGVFELDLLFLSFIFVLVEILLTVFIAPRHGVFGSRPAPSLRPDGGSPGALHWGRVALLGAGLFFIAIAMGAGIDDLMTDRGPGLALVLAFVFVLAGEVAGRFHFYGLVVRPGR